MIFGTDLNRTLAKQSESTSFSKNCMDANRKVHQKVAVGKLYDWTFSNIRFYNR